MKKMLICLISVIIAFAAISLPTSAIAEEGLQIDVPDMVTSGYVKRNIELPAPSVTGNSGDYTVLVTITAPTGASVLSEEYDMMYGVTFNPSLEGKYKVVYSVTDAAQNTASKEFEISVTVNPLDFGIGDYRGAYIGEGHFEDYPDSKTFYENTEFKTYSEDKNTKLNVDVSSGNAFSGNNCMRIDYPEEVSVVYYMINLTQKPMAKDDSTTYTVKFLLKHEGGLTFEDKGRLVVRMENKVSATFKGSSVFHTTHLISKTRLSKMTEWTVVKFDFISRSDAFIYGDEELMDNESRDAQYWDDALEGQSTNTAMAFCIYNYGVKGSVYVDDISITKAGDEIPDYKEEYKDTVKPVDPNQGSDGADTPSEGKKGCKGEIGALESAAFVVVLLAGILFTERKKLKI